MAPSFALPQIVPIEAIKLGRFSTSIQPPFFDFYDADDTEQPGALVAYLQNYRGDHHASINSSFSASLTSLISMVLSKRTKTNIQIETDTYKVYSLERPDTWFEKAAATSAWRQWAERKYHCGEDIYMVIGFHTTTDALIIEDSAVGRVKEGQVKLPITSSLATAGVIIPLGDVLDPSLGKATEATSIYQSKFIARGEQVYAVEYRQVSPRWLSSKKLDNLRLTKAPRWMCGERLRNEVEGQDDLIEVELTELNTENEEWMEEVMGNDTFLIVASEESEL